MNNNFDNGEYKKVTIMNSVLDLNHGEKYRRITIYSDFVNRNGDYAIIDYEKYNGDALEGQFQKKIPSTAIKDALSEFEMQKGKKISYGVDVEVKNVNEVLNEKGMKM